jgi:uncharacterized protein (UPF0548 family)
MWTFRRAAACGAAVVACQLAISGQALDLIAVATTLLLVGALIAVPLALALADPGAVRGRWHLARLIWLPAGCCLVASCSFAPGPVAAWLAVPWLLFTLFIALLGALHAAERGGGPAAEVAIDAGLVFLAVGGAWTFASRAALPVLGFEEPWLLLTAAHFHFAGLVLPIVAGRASRLATGPLGALACIGVVIGVPAVAIGITAGARGHASIEWLAALLLLLAALAVAAQLTWLATRCERMLPAALLALASLALCGGMALVAVYATTTWLGAQRLSLLDMTLTHAPLQVLGFALPALIALHLLPQPTPVAQMQIVLPWLGDQPAPQAFVERPFGPEVTPGARGVATDRHECELPSEPPGPPLPEGPFRRAAAAARSYRSFPARMITGLREQDPVVAGETVVARYRMLPGVHLVFAARVVEVFDGAANGTHRAGFAYRTLTGHPECGVETFAVEKDLATGRVRAVVSAHSRCGTWLTRQLRPLARRLQLAAGRAAVANLRAIASGDGSARQA